MHSRRRGTYVEHRYARDAVLIPRPCPRSVTSITFMPVDELERYGPECDLEYGDEKEADQDGSFLLWGNGLPNILSITRNLFSAGLRFSGLATFHIASCLA
ncbi:Uncharacterized protein HZ326_23786 [Fusarium oxysporum f. sp. albedinis]|nr:Uncharacterized protein HZ326_23786 [Fusarium oxysporum f. sp. albedinis]